MTYRLKNGRDNPPPLDVVIRIASEEAAKAGLTRCEIFGPSRPPRFVKARTTAWSRILTETKCSMNGLAKVWGCDRQSIRRGVGGEVIEHPQPQAA